LKWNKKIDDSRHHTNTVVQEGNNVAVEIPEAQEKINWENKQHQEEMHELVERNKIDYQEFEKMKVNDQKFLDDEHSRYCEELEIERAKYHEIQPTVEQIKADMNTRVN